MKNKHARTHGFIIQISRGCRLFADALPTDEFEKRYVMTLPEHAQNVYDRISEALPSREVDPYDASAMYVTPDFSDAIGALFAFVEYGLIDSCDAYGAAMMFTEAFYGFEVAK